MTRSMARKNSEQRNVTRTAGKFAPMDKCEMCKKPGTLEPAFGGDSTHEHDPAWGLLICRKCSKRAFERCGLVWID